MTVAEETERRPSTTDTTPTTVDLTAGDQVDTGLLGGKGAALAELVRAGYPVPATGVVTTAAYRSVAADSAIRSLIDQIATGSDEPFTAEEVDEAFAEVAVAPDLARVIAQMAQRVGAGGPVAVRSSATVEDLHGSSFAGQYRSLLDIDSSSPAAVMSAVRAVWASLWHPAPSAYREAFSIDEADVAMAVVVMRMIPATSAGVVFTIDPGGSGGARVEAVEGLGEALVSGRTTPAAWVVPRPGDGGAGSVDEGPLPAAPAKALDLSIAIEQHFGTPQDIEWAAVGSDVDIVQARPITVLDEDDGFDTALDDHELTTAGIVEMVPGVLPPLRWEINRFLLEEAFRSVLDSLGIIRGTEAEDRPFVRRVRGRVAIDFDQLRDAAAGIPGAVAELEKQYFGRADERAGAPDAGPGHRRGRLASLARDVRTLRTRHQVIEQAEILIKATTALRSRRPSLDSFDDTELLAYGRRLIDLGARGLAAELGVAASGAAAYQRLQAQLSSHLGADEGQRMAQVVTAQSGATVERSNQASAAIFGGPTWSERGATPPATPGDPGDWQHEHWPDLRDRLRAIPGWTRRRILTGGFIDIRLRLVHRLVADVVEQLRRREAAKAAFLELGGEVRRVELTLGERLMKRGVLERPADVELLTSAELQHALRGGEPVAPDALRRRRNWLSRYDAEGGLPVRFAGRPDRSPKPLPEGDVLDGWAASPGRRRGSVRVVTSATGRLERGEVLVANATDASWSPLFLRAGAVVVEQGGPLSHAAILARELGLPAVLNVEGASQLLDGCLVTVDGDRGQVVIESRSDDQP